MGKRKGFQTAVFLCFTAAFLGGTAIPELIRMGSGSYAGFFSLYSFGLYEQAEIRPFDLFIYILRIRIPVLLFLWMSTYTAAGLLFHLLYGGWLAASAGMLLALFALRDGYNGLLLLACCLFPQWILYAAVLQKEADILMRRYRDGRVGQNVPSPDYVKKQIGENAGQEAAADMENWQKKNTGLERRTQLRRTKWRDMQELAGLLAFCAVGCACEAFLGTWTLKIFLQFSH